MTAAAAQTTAPTPPAVHPAEGANSVRVKNAPAENISADDPRWQAVLDLPCELTVELPLPGFTVSDFLRLQRGSVRPTHWRLTRDVPLRVNGTLIAWGELEGVGQHLAIRLTELA